MQSGILLPVFSLPDKYGIGSFGKEAYKFVDFLKAGGIKIWQILPLNQTSYGDSPYQSPSAFAGNPYFIDIDTLVSDKLLTRKEADTARKDWESIDYGSLFYERYPLLEKAYIRFVMNKPAAFKTFCRKQAGWLNDYAVFMAVKKENGYRSFLEWPEEQRLRKNPEALYKKYEDQAEFWKFLQFEFFKQYTALRKYANRKGIKILGDMPIYVALDSADTWANKSEFCLNEEGKPTDVAGVPPDYFSEDGQLWGNPLYNWDGMKKDGFSWWKARLENAFELYDYVRIDHFRAFYNYYAIPATSPTAKIGEWRMGPGLGFFETLGKHFGKMPIIAEDLGDLSPGVYELLDKIGYPGMKVLQFAFGGGDDNIYLPFNYKPNCIVYTGTHDNDTLCGWLDTLDDYTKSRVEKLVPHRKNQNMCDAIIRYAHSSIAETSIIPMQDYLNLGTQARMNIPSTLGGNWRWRMPKNYARKKNIERIRNMMKQYGRI